MNSTTSVETTAIFRHLLAYHRLLCMLWFQMKDLCVSISAILLVALPPVTCAHTLPPSPLTMHSSAIISDQSCSDLHHLVSALQTLLSANSSGGVCRSALSSGPTVIITTFGLFLSMLTVPNFIVFRFRRHRLHLGCHRAPAAVCLWWDCWWRMRD